MCPAVRQNVFQNRDWEQENQKDHGALSNIPGFAVTCHTVPSLYGSRILELLELYDVGPRPRALEKHYRISLA